MKKDKIISGFALITLLLISAATMAQNKIEVSEQDVSGWFAKNWMWVAGVVVFLLILALVGRGSNRRKTTTVVKDNYGNVRSVTTTEVKE